MIEPKVTSIRYYASSTKPRAKPKKGDRKFIKGTGFARRGWYERDFERVTCGPYKGALVRGSNGLRYQWVRMDPQPPEPENV